MSNQFITDSEMQTLARVSRKLGQHINMRQGEDLSFSGEIHAVDSNGERLGVFYSVGDGWDFYPTGNLPKHREISTDEKDALERLYTLLDANTGASLDDLIEILPSRNTDE